jgi:hypothetical protein
MDEFAGTFSVFPYRTFKPDTLITVPNEAWIEWYIINHDSFQHCGKELAERASAEVFLYKRV